jgi:glycosyltransferase involved in cell wall biosynthesis
MRLCLFSPPLTYRGGVGKLSVNLIKHLAHCSSVDEIFVVCDSISDDVYESLKHKKLNIECTGSVRRSDFLRVIVRNTKYIRLADKLRRFDLYHVLDARVFPFINPGLHPLVVTIHNVMMLELLAVLKATKRIGIENILGNIDLYMPQLPLEFLLITRARAIVVNSPLVEEQLRNLYGSIVQRKTRIISPGFDPLIFNGHHMRKSDAKRLLSLDPSAKILLHIGGMSRPRSGERKGLLYLLNALDYLHRTGYLDRLNIQLVVLGEIGRKNIVSFSGVQKHVVELHEVKEDLMPTLFRAADVFVMPSISEGWGIALMEALACGTPVIASPFVPSALALKDLSAVHIENGLNNPVRFAKSILQVLENRTCKVNDWNRLSNTLAAEYSWKNYVIAHMNLYREVLEEGAHRSEVVYNARV